MMMGVIKLLFSCFFFFFLQNLHYIILPSTFYQFQSTNTRTGALESSLFQQVPKLNQYFRYLLLTFSKTRWVYTNHVNYLFGVQNYNFHLKVISLDP